MDLSQPWLMKLEHAAQVIAVLAHESGHNAAAQSARGLVAFLGGLGDQEPLPPNRH